MNIHTKEVKLRRWAKNKNLKFIKTRIRDKRDIEYGTYQIIINKTGEIKRGLSLNQIEEFILNYQRE